MYNRKDFKEKLFRETIFLDLNLKVWSGRDGMFPGQKDSMRAVACGPDCAAVSVLVLAAVFSWLHLQSGSGGRGPAHPAGLRQGLAIRNSPLRAAGDLPWG